MYNSISYYGQDPTGYTHIGTEELKFPVAEWPNLDDAVAELKRRCGKMCEINLYVEVSDNA